MNIKITLFILSIFFTFGCKKESDKETVDISFYLKEGKEISIEAQTLLLQKVMSAIKDKGSSYAIEYCNLNASELIDSLSQNKNAVIKRVSDKNRNPLNAASENFEYTFFAEGYKSKDLAVWDTVITANKNLIYYRPIVIGMPACLNCHGDIENDIESETLQKIDKLYTEDKARNYKLGELRGLWKIIFNTI